MTQTRKYRVALVGCGAIAETGHVPALLKHPQFELAALCDVRAGRAALLAKQAGGVETCHDYRSLLDRKDLDAVILALHPELSVDVAIDFLRRQKPVLDEKPLAATLADGHRLAHAVAETGGVYQIGFVFRYCALVRQVAEIARQIGTPAIYRVGIFDERLDRQDTDHFQRIQQIFRASSAVTHEGSHVLDYFQLWNSAPLTQTQAMALKTEPDFDGPNLWSAQFRARDGSVLQLEIGWLLPTLPPSTISITGPRGSFQLRLADGAGELALAGVKTAVRVEPLIQNWQAQLDVFAEAIAGGKSRVATVADGLRALAATKACEKAAATGSTVALETATLP